MIDTLTLDNIHYRVMLMHPDWSITGEYVNEVCFSELLTKDMMTSNDMVRSIVRLDVKNGQAILPQFVRRICHDIIHDDCPTVVRLVDACACNNTYCEHTEVRIRGSKIKHKRIGRSIRPYDLLKGTLWADLEMYPTDCNGNLIIPIHYTDMLVALIEYNYYMMHMPSKPGQWDIQLLSIYKNNYNEKVSDMVAASFGQQSFDDLQRGIDMYKFTQYTNVKFL